MNWVLDVYVGGIIGWICYDLFAFTYWTLRKQHDRALKRAKSAVWAPLWPIFLGLGLLVILYALLVGIGIRIERWRLRREMTRHRRLPNRGPAHPGPPGKPPEGGSGISRPRKD